MLVIFLDIDGVLNSEEYARKLEEKHRALGHTEPASPKRETTCDCFKLYHQIDRDAVKRLNVIVRATGAKIVVSSSWRKVFDPPEVHRILSEHGLVAEIIDATVDGHKEPALLELYGHPARLFRGYEIDYWLKAHPEIERFVILDDGSDMAMHENRLVQTDCEDGLCDEHVELAIRVLAWDGKTQPSPFDDFLPIRRLPIVSTRSNISADARRDFDGFDVDEELQLLRRALRDGYWRVAAELMSNLDEHLCRGGSLPVGWLGPGCMQEEGDLKDRHARAVKRAENMAPEDREETTDFVRIEPELPALPGSSDGIHCHHNSRPDRHSDGQCPEALVLSRTTTVQPSHADDYQEMFPALTEAAVFLGWRVYQSVYWCPTHVVAMNLACKRCRAACPACSCLGGPMIDAVEGDIKELS